MRSITPTPSAVTPSRPQNAAETSTSSSIAASARWATSGSAEPASNAPPIRSMTGTPTPACACQDTTGWARRSGRSPTSTTIPAAPTHQTPPGHIPTSLPTPAFPARSPSSSSDPTTTIPRSTPGAQTSAMLSVLPQSTHDPSD